METCTTRKVERRLIQSLLSGISLVSLINLKQESRPFQSQPGARRNRYRVPGRSNRCRTWCRTWCRTGSSTQGELILIEVDTPSVTISYSLTSSYAYFFSPPTGAPSTGTKAGNDPATIIQTSDPPVTITLSGSVTTTSPTPTTLPSSPYPTANSSVYTATNKPLPTLSPQSQSQTAEPSLSFEIYLLHRIQLRTEAARISRPYKPSPTSLRSAIAWMHVQHTTSK